MQKINGELLKNKNAGFRKNKKEKLRPLRTLQLNHDHDKHIIFSLL